MDRFDQTFRDLLKLPMPELTVKLESLKGMCICAGCPTHTSCAKDAKEILFCAIGRSFHCVSVDKGCI
jgi:hypothetical protein